MSKVTVAQLFKLHDEINQGRITRELLQTFLENPSGFVTKGLHPSSTLAAALIPKGWTVIEDVAPSTFKVRDLKFKSFFERGEFYITSKKMRQRAIDMKGNLGLVDGQYLLEHQAEIHVGLGGKYIVLPGTLLRDLDDCLRVPCLSWDGGRWYLIFCRLDGGWDDRGRFAFSE